MLTPHGDPLGRIGEPDIGGQCVYIRELAKQLSSQGMNVVAFTRDRSDGRPPSESFAPSATVVRVPCGPAGFIPKEALLPHLDAFAEAVASHLEGHEVLHSHYWDGGYVASCLRTTQAWFHSTHSLGRIKQQSLPDGSRYAYDDRIRIEESVYQGCDQVFALTQIEKEQIHQLYGVPEPHILVIPPGVDPGIFRPRGSAREHRAHLGLPEGTTVLTLGRLDERKGLDLFLRAAALLQSRVEPPLSFVMSAGHPDMPLDREHETIATLIDSLQLGRSLTWMPVADEQDLPTLYNASDLFVLPSRYEPFGIVMLEAMASGIPVVATRNGGPATVISHQQDGLLGDPEDSASFAGLIGQLADSPETRRVYGARARAKVESQYSWAAIAKQFVSAYRVGSDGETDAR